MPQNGSVDSGSLISVVLSFRNEELVLPELIQRLTVNLERCGLSHELIFVDDASTDASHAILLQHMQRDARIKIIRMSRCFGVSECTLAGMRHSGGDALVYLDADLQDPPELIPDLVEKWKAGADVVHTVRSERLGESSLNLALTDLAYALIGYFADIPLISEAGDFKLLSRRVVNELLKMPEKTPYLRGLVSWIGFRQETVTYKREARFGGDTKFPLFKHIFRDLSNLRGRIGTLVIGLTSFSLFPIAILLTAGGVLCLIGVLGIAIATLHAIFGSLSAPWGPWAAGGFLMVSGIQLLGMGILGVYIGRVYQDVRGRPMYIIEMFDGQIQTTSRNPAEDHAVSSCDDRKSELKIRACQHVLRAEVLFDHRPFLGRSMLPQFPTRARQQASDTCCAKVVGRIEKIHTVDLLEDSGSFRSRTERIGKSIELGANQEDRSPREELYLCAVR